MTLQGSPQRKVPTEATRTGWVLSLLLHGILILSALLFVQRVRLAPQTESFTWNVEMVSPDLAPTPSTPTSPAPSPTPTPTKQTTPTHAVRTATAPPASPATLPEPIRQVTAVTPASPALMPKPQEERRLSSPALQTIAPTPPITAHAIESEPPPHEDAHAPSSEPSRLTQHMETTPAPSLLDHTSRGENPPQISKSPTAVTAPITPMPTPEPPPSPSDSQTTPTAPQLVDPTPTASTQSTQVASRATSTANTPTRPDYGWLSEAILHRVEELKRYPPEARVDRAEGKVVVKAVINEDGSIGEVEVFRSSGHPSLDKAAVETMKQAAPFHLSRPLGQPRMTIKIPMSYRLDR